MITPFEITPEMLAYAFQQVDAPNNITKFYGEIGEDYLSTVVFSISGTPDEQKKLTNEFLKVVGSLDAPCVFKFGDSIVHAWVTWQDGMEVSMTEYGCEDCQHFVSFIADKIKEQSGSGGDISGIVFPEVPTKYEGAIPEVENPKILGNGKTAGVYYSSFLRIAQGLGMPDEEELQRQREAEAKAVEWLKEAIFDPDAKGIEQEKPLLLSGGVPAIFPHDFVLLTASKKAGKSTLVAAMAAAMASDAEVLNFSRPEGTKSLRVLICDTEQQDIDLMAKRTLMYQLAEGANLDVQIFTLLKFPSPSEKKKFIQGGIKDLSPDVVIIDGIVDILDGRDFNDARSSIGLIDEIKGWCASGPAIIGVIHGNSSSQASDKSRGHLGSEAENKAEVLLRLDAKATNAVRTLRFNGRHTQRPSDFSFVLDDGGMHIVSDKDGNEERKTSWSNFDWRDYLEPGRKYTRDELVACLKMFKPDIKDGFIKVKISDGIKGGFITKDGNKYELRE